MICTSALQISRLLMGFCSRAGWRFLFVRLGDAVDLIRLNVCFDIWTRELYCLSLPFLFLQKKRVCLFLLLFSFFFLVDDYTAYILNYADIYNVLVSMDEESQQCKHNAATSNKIAMLEKSTSPLYGKGKLKYVHAKKTRGTHPTCWIWCEHVHHLDMFYP